VSKRTEYEKGNANQEEGDAWRNESGSYEVMMAFSAVIRSWSGRKALFPANAGIVEL
jgi:hypothetical protein